MAYNKDGISESLLKKLSSAKNTAQSSIKTKKYDTSNISASLAQKLGLESADARVSVSNSGGAAVNLNSSENVAKTKKFLKENPTYMYDGKSLVKNPQAEKAIKDLKDYKNAVRIMGKNVTNFAGGNTLDDAYNIAKDKRQKEIDTQLKLENDYKHITTYEQAKKEAEKATDETTKNYLLNKADGLKTRSDYESEIADLENQIAEVNKRYAEYEKYPVKDPKLYENTNKHIEDLTKRLTKVKDSYEKNKSDLSKRELTDFLNKNPKVHSTFELLYNIEESKKQNTANADEAVHDKFEVNELYTDADSINAQNALKELEKKHGKDTIDNYYKWFERVKEEEKNSYNLEIAKKRAELNPVLTSIESVTTGLVGSVFDNAQQAGAYFGKKFFGGDGYFDPNATNAKYVDTIRGTVSSGIDNDVLKWLYDNGMSLADSGASMALNFVPFIGPALSAGSNYSRAQAHGFNDAYERTGNVQNAFYSGIAQGVAELVFEKVSLDQLIDIKNVGVSSFKDLGLNIAKSAFVEGSEETFTEIANTVTDQIINKDLSNINLSFKNYIAQGYSEEKAWEKVKEDYVMQLGQAFLGGALGGYVFGGGVSAYSYANNRHNTKTLSTSSKEMGQAVIDSGMDAVEEVISNGLKSKNGKISKLATKLEQIKNSGKKVDASDIGNLLKLQETDSVNVEEVVNAGLQEKVDTPAYNLAVTLKEQLNKGETIAINHIRALERELGLKKVSQATDDGVIEYKNKGDVKVTISSTLHPNGLYAQTRKGKKVIIAQVESADSKSNSAKILTTDGAVIDTSDLSISDQNYRALFTMAENFDTNGAKALVANYEKAIEEVGEISGSEYAEHFYNLYEASKDGITFEQAKNVPNLQISINHIGTYTSVLAMRSAQNDINPLTKHWKNSVELVKEVTVNDNAVKLKSGHIYADENVDVKNADISKQLAILDGLAKKANIDIVLSSTLSDYENGRYEDGRIIINANKPSEYITSVVMHEVGHDIKANNPDAFETLTDFVLDYLKAKNVDIEKRLTEIKRQYKRVFNPDTAREMATEELVCNTLMSIPSEQEAMNVLSEMDIKEKRSLLRALKDFIERIKNYLKKHGLIETKAFTDDFEAINKLANMVNESIVREREKTKNDGTKFSIKNTVNNIPVIVVNDNILSNSYSEKDIIKTVKQSLGRFKRVPIKGQSIHFISDTKSEYVGSKYTQWLKNNDKQTYQDKMRVAGHPQDIVYATTEYINEGLKHPRKDNIVDFARGKILIDVSGRQYSAEVVIGFMKNGICELHDIVGMRPTKFEYKKEVTPEGMDSEESTRSGVTSNDNIPLNTDIVNNQFMPKSKKYSLTEIDNTYMSAVESGDMETAQRMVDEEAKNNGYTIRAFHGTARGDRVGNVFLPERATSGPMAFFTSNETIASNYARDKADTSIAYDEEYDNYYTQFRVQKNGKSISIEDLWNTLPLSEKAKIKERAKHITFDDEAENIIYDSKAQYGVGGFDAYRINSNKGNYLSALIEEWLVDGNLYGEEHRFLDVLKLVGLNGIEYRNPNARYEKVYNVYLKITNPFNTNNVDINFVHSLKNWYYKQDVSKYERLSASADMWDKNNRNIDDFISRLNDDIENRTTHAWTSIPDFVTDYLKSMKYDGIEDLGGKAGGYEHIVYIPFYSSQIKSSDPVTYDDNGNVILLSERFKDSNNDIRYSLTEPGEINDVDLIDLFEDSEEAFDYDFTGNNLDFSQDTKEAIQNTNKILADMNRLTKGKKISKEALLKICKKKIKEYSSKQDADILCRDMQIILNALEQSKEQDDFNTVFFEMIGLCKNVLDKSMIKVDLFKEERENVKAFLKDYGRIRVDSEQVAEIASAFDGWNNYRKKMFGFANLIKSDNPNSYGRPTLDMVWDELCEFCPGLCDPDINPLEAPMALLNLKEKLKPTYEHLYLNMDEQALEMAQELLAEIYNAKYENDTNAKLDEAHSTYKESLKKQQEKQEERYAKQLKAEREKFSQQKKEHREKMKEAEKLKGVSQEMKMLNKSLVVETENEIKIVEVNAKNPDKVVALYDRKKASEYREKIRKQLVKLARMANKPNKGEYVPYEIVNALRNVIKSIAVKEEGQAVPKSWGTFEDLRDAYIKLGQGGFDEYKKVFEENNVKFIPETIAYSKTIETELENMAEYFKGKALYAMSGADLEDTYHLLEAIINNITTARQMVIDDKLMQISKVAFGAINELKEIGPKTDNVAKDLFNRYILSTTSPKRVFAHLANYDENSNIYKLGEMLDKGQDKAIQLKLNSNMIFSEFATKYKKELKELTGEKAKLIDTGIIAKKPIYVTPGMALSVYMHCKNSDNLKHIKNGGITFPDVELYRKGKISESFDKGQKISLTTKELNKICSIVEQNPILFEASKLMTDLFEQHATEINNTTVVLFGYESATVENYFPIHTDSNFLQTDIDALKFDKTLAGSGFLKNRVKASNPVYLEDAFDVVLKQIEQVSEFCGLAIPISNFMKVYNTVAGDYKYSFKSVLKDTWGKKTVNFIEKLITDLQGNKSSYSMMNRARSNFAQAVLSFNVSVTVKQLAAYPTAASVIGWKPLAKAMSKGVKRADLDLMRKYTPLMWYRDQGNREKGLKDVTGKKKTLEKAPALFNWVQKADSAVVGRLWYACEYYVNDNYADLKKGTDDYYMQVAEVFNKMVKETQQNYTTMQSPQILRNNNEIVREITMFMSQNLQEFGMVFEATGNLRAKAKAYSDNKTVANKKALKQAKKQFARAISAKIVSGLTFSMLTMVTAFLMNRREKYADENGEITLFSAGGEIINDLFANLAGCFVFGSEIYDFIYSGITGENYYGVGLASLQPVMDLADHLQKAMQGNGDTLKIWKDVIFDVSTLSGLPVENMYKVFEAGYGHIQNAINGTMLSPDYAKMANSQKAIAMYNALIKGDREKYAKIYNTFIAQGKEDKDIQQYLKTVLSSRNSLVTDGAKAYINNNYDVYENSITELEEIGFATKTIKSAIELKVKELGGEKEEAPTETKTYTVDEIFANNTESIYDKDMLWEELIEGNDDNFDMIYSELLESGLTEKQIEQSINSRKRSLIDKYLEAVENSENINAAEYYEQLVNAYGSDSKADKAIEKEEKKDKEKD